MRKLGLLVLSCWVASPVAGTAVEKVDFKTPPKTLLTNQGVVITFAVNQTTDVEVAILDPQGKVVKHLAAGVLGGKNPPPAPLQTGLEQKIIWNHLNNAGKAAGKGPFSIRVRLGTGVQFGKMIGESPYTGSVTSMPYRAPVNGLVTDAQGNLYVLMMSSIGSHGNSGMWPWHLRKFDHEGKYLQSLLPYAPSTKAESASGVTLLPTEAFTPANRTSLYPVFSVFGNEVGPRLVNGQLVFIHSEKREIHFFALDGSNQVKRIPMWTAKEKLNCPIWLDMQVAFSPDGKFAYYSNVAGTAYDGKKPSDIDERWPQGRIYRQDLTQESALPLPFFELTLPDFEKEKYWMPSAWDKKTAAAGIDTDAKGNVLVCDLVNGQIVEISPEGKQLSATKVAWPDKVIVSRKTGDLYVISRKVSRGFLPPATLTKIVGRGDKAKVAAELQLKGTVGGAYTLDESGKTPVLWLGGMIEETGTVRRIEDRGEEFVDSGENYINRDPNAITFVGYMDVDREAEYVYVTRSGGTVWRFHGETGKGGPLAIKAVDLAIGPNGDVYTWGTSGSYQGPIARFTRDLKPNPLESTGKHTYGELYGRAGRGSSVCGIDVDSTGRVFATYGTNECHVRVYDEKGELVDYPRKYRHVIETKSKEIPVAISGVTGYGGSIRVDRQGNLYLLQAGLPKGFTVPKGFEKDEAYRAANGTIYKFPPKGGEVNAPNGTVKEVTGSVAQYPDCGPVSRWNAVGACACTKPRFDVDDFGRLYIPNGITYSVSMRDNADNEIVRFGGYGNFDSRGGANAKPEIPLGWAITVGASDRYIYVGDCLNHRVVRVDKKFAVEKVIRIEE